MCTLTASIFAGYMYRYLNHIEYKPDLTNLLCTLFTYIHAGVYNVTILTAIHLYYSRKGVFTKICNAYVYADKACNAVTDIYYTGTYTFPIDVTCTHKNIIQTTSEKVYVTRTEYFYKTVCIYIKND